MPYRTGYRRRHFRRRRYGGSRRKSPRGKYSGRYGAQGSWFEKAMHYGGIAADLAKKIATVAAMVNSEMHIYQATAQTISPTSGSSDGEILNPISVGDQNPNRTGTTIRGKYIDLRMLVSQNADATTNTLTGIAVCICPSPNNLATFPTWTDVFATSKPYSLRNMTNIRQFIVLKRWSVLTGIDDGTTSLPTYRQLSYYKKLDLKTTFQRGETTGTISKFENGLLFVVATSDQVTYNPQIDLEWNYGFRDN